MRYYVLKLRKFSTYKQFPFQISLKPFHTSPITKIKNQAKTIKTVVKPQKLLKILKLMKGSKKDGNLTKGN